MKKTVTIITAAITFLFILFIFGFNFEDKKSNVISKVQFVKKSSSEKKPKGVASKKSGQLWTSSKDSKLESFMHQWGKSVDQTYAKYDGTKSIITTSGKNYPQDLANATVDGKKVKIAWDKKGTGKNDYNVVAIYNHNKSSSDSSITYAFTLADGEPIVLVNEGSGNNWSETKNKSLRENFVNIFDGKATHIEKENPSSHPAKPKAAKRSTVTEKTPKASHESKNSSTKSTTTSTSSKKEAAKSESSAVTKKETEKASSKKSSTKSSTSKSDKEKASSSKSRHVSYVETPEEMRGTWYYKGEDGMEKIIIDDHEITHVILNEEDDDSSSSIDDEESDSTEGRSGEDIDSTVETSEDDENTTHLYLYKKDKNNHTNLISDETDDKEEWGDAKYINVGGIKYLNVSGWKGKTDGAYYTLHKEKIDGEDVEVLVLGSGSEIWTDKVYYSSEELAKKQGDTKYDDLNYR